MRGCQLGSAACDATPSQRVAAPSTCPRSCFWDHFGRRVPLPSQPLPHSLLLLRNGWDSTPLCEEHCQHMRYQTQLLPCKRSDSGAHTRPRSAGGPGLCSQLHLGFINPFAHSSTYSHQRNFSLYHLHSNGTKCKTVDKEEEGGAGGEGRGSDSKSDALSGVCLVAAIAPSMCSSSLSLAPFHL